jgi:hypothetical protein
MYLPQDNIILPTQFLTPAQLPTSPQFENIYRSPRANYKSTLNLSRGLEHLLLCQGGSFEDIKLPSLLTSAKPAMMPIYSVCSSMHNETSLQRSHPYAHSNHEIILKPDPIGGNVLSMIWLKEKYLAWHLVTSIARDLHTCQTFSHPNRMWSSPINNKADAKEALFEISCHYISSHQHLRLPTLEESKY